MDDMTGLIDILLTDNVKHESVFINIIQMVPNVKTITSDSKSQISESSQSNFSAENERQLVTNIKVEKNMASTVQKELPYHFPKDTIKEISSFNHQESKINKNMLPILDIKSEVTNFEGKNSVQCKGLQNNNITNSKYLITNIHETEFNKYPCSAVGNCIDSNSDVILMKVECDESCGSSSDTNVYTTKNTEFHSQNAETFDHCLQSDKKGLSIAKDVGMLSHIRCKKNSLDSSCCNALKCNATNDSLKEKSNKLLNSIENKKILGSDESKYWLFDGIPLSSVDIKIEAAISPNGKAEKTVHSEMLNPVVSRCTNNPSALLNINTENIEDSKMLNSDVSQYCANDVPFVSVNIKTEKIVSSEISNSDVTECCINDIPSALLNIKTEKIVDSESSHCNDANYCSNDIPSASMNNSNKKTEKIEELNCDIPKNCSNGIPPVSLNIKMEKTEDIETVNCDIPKNCIIPPVSLNIKSEASSSFVSKENYNVKITENSSTCNSNTYGLDHKSNFIVSFKNIQFSSKNNNSNEVLDTELPSTSKVNVLSMSTATDGINKSDITYSCENFSSESSSNYVGGKSNGLCKNKKNSCGEDSEQYQLNYIQNNIFRLASSSLCPVTKDKHPKLVLQSYKCDKCNGIFYFEKHYRLHQIMHENSVYDKQFKNSDLHLVPSEVQDLDSKNEDVLNQLKSKHHKQEAKVSVLKKLLHSEMNNKMLPKETVITYKCELCDEKFNVQYDYQSHQIFQQQPKFKCVVCSKDFESSSSCKSHEKECLERSRSEYEESYDECHICGYKPFIHSSRTLKQHMQLHSTERPFKCNQCEKTFTNKKNLRAHQQNHKNREPVTCKICGKSYKNKTSLYSHSRTHKSLSKECHLCDAKFVNLTDLKKHYTKHTGEKPYSCDICDKSFRTKKVLEIHLSVHCNEKYLCEFCGKELSSKYHLVKHKSVHLNGKQFKCKICSKMFNYETNLKQHLLTHSDKRIHACKLCNKKFKRPHHLRQHQQTHL